MYSTLGSGLFSMYLVFDTQLMMGNKKTRLLFKIQNLFSLYMSLGGKHNYSISPEDYVIANLNLYLDVINIFFHILRLIGLLND